MKILRWTGLIIALAAAAVVTGCGVEVYDRPGYPGRHQGGWRGDEDRAGDVQGTVLRVSRHDHVIVVDPGDDREEGEDRDGREGRREIVLFYDDSTTVEYEGRDFRPEDLERGDRIQASVDLRGDRGVAEDIQVIYDASSGRNGRMVAEQILVIGDARRARPSRTSIGSTGPAQTPSSRQPRISSNPASTSDQNPRLPVLLGR